MIMVESKRGFPVTDRALAVGWRRRINGAFCKAEFLRYVAALIGADWLCDALDGLCGLHIL